MTQLTREQQISALETPFREHVAVEHPNGGGDSHRSDGHLGRVPEIAFDAMTAQPDAGLPPGVDPGFHRPLVRQRDDAARIDLRQWLERLLEQPPRPLLVSRWVQDCLLLGS